MLYERSCERSWSCIDHKPLSVYYRKTNTNVIFWNGVTLTRGHALMIYGLIWCNITPSISQVRHAFGEYKKIQSGQNIENYDSFEKEDDKYFSLSRLIFNLNYSNNYKGDFFDILKKKFNSKDALLWFLPEKTIIIE